MPEYDYRCKNCKERFTLFFKTYADYDTATPNCPKCESDQLARIISGVKFKQPGRDFGGMSSQEMFSVLEAGDSREVGEMFKQVGAAVPDEVGSDFHEATDRLLSGEKAENIDKDLSSRTAKPSPDKPKSVTKTKKKTKK
jgi:putative FmdB family regulatory protein